MVDGEFRPISTTVGEARKASLEIGALIYWRPMYTNYSPVFPEDDEAVILTLEPKPPKA